MLIVQQNGQGGFEMSEYTKHIAKGSNEYLSLAAKTSYVRDYLLSVNNRLSELILIGAENDERKPLADIEFEDLIARRDKILADTSLCYTDEEIKSFEDDRLPSDAFEQFANDPNNSAEVRNTASDMVALEDSVADAKLAYEIDSKDFERTVIGTDKMVSIAEDIEHYEDNPDIVQITPEDEERLQKANDAIKALKGSPENVNLQAEAKRRAMYEIGKHPFSYAIYAAKNSIKEIVRNVREGRQAVRAAEGSMIDSIAASTMALTASIGAKSSDALNMALGATKHAGVEAAKMLNQAYTAGSEMLERAKEGLLSVYRALSRKCEHLLEIVSLGAYSNTLSKIALTASVAETKENPTGLEKLAMATMRLSQFELGYKPEEISEHISELKESVWGHDKKSILDKTNEFTDNFMLQAEIASEDAKTKVVAFKDSALEFLSDSSKKISNTMEDLEKKVVLASNMAKAKVAEASLNVQATTYKTGVCLLSRIHKLNEYRVNKLTEKISKDTEKIADLKEYVADLEKGITPAKEKSEFVPSVELVAAIDSLKRIENKSTAEMFAEKALVNKLEKEKTKFEVKQDLAEEASRLERSVYDSELEATNETIDRINDRIAHLEESVQSVQARGAALLDKMGQWDAAKQDLEVKVAKMQENNRNEVLFESSSVDDKEESDREMDN